MEVLIEEKNEEENRDKGVGNRYGGLYLECLKTSTWLGTSVSSKLRAYDTLKQSVDPCYRAWKQGISRLFDLLVRQASSSATFLVL
jgi:hypothetical protein